jgi:hypothetical protein
MFVPLKVHPESSSEVSFPSPGLWSEFSTGVPSMISFGDGGDILICGLNDSSDFATHNNSSF